MASSAAAPAPAAPAPAAPQGSRGAAPAPQGNGASPHSELGAPAAEAAPDFNLEGLIRDERGIRMAPESDD
jgi:hypothetical protein